jgi:hypothetical protein
MTGRNRLTLYAHGSLKLLILKPFGSLESLNLRLGGVLLHDLACLAGTILQDGDVLLVIHAYL